MNWQGAIMNKNLKSSAKAAAFAALLAVSAGGYAQAADMPVKAPPPAAKPVPFFFVNDTSVSFTWYPNSTDPGVSGSSNKTPGGVFGRKNSFSRYQGSIDHFDVWEYGTNLIHAEFNQYGDQDPTQGVPGATGSREFFGFARSTISLNDVTHSKMFSNPIFTDLGIEVGGTAGVQNDFLSEETTVGLAGLSLNLNLPGTVIVSILADKEFTYNNFNACGNLGFGVAVNGLCAPAGVTFNGNRSFETTWKIESFVAEKVPFLPNSFPVSFINILNVEGPKGTGISRAQCLALGCGAAPGTPGGGINGFANNETKTEIFEDARLSLDTSKVFWGKPGIWDTYIGYRYWENKFGTNHSAALFSLAAPGTSIESTVYTGMTYHFK